MIQDSISSYNRKWSNMSLLYRIEQLKKEKERSSISKTSLVIRRRSDYFYIQEPPGQGRVFLPDSLFREIWESLSTLLILYQSFIIPYLLSYASLSATDHFLTLLACDCFFIIEIVLNFNTGFFSDGILVKYRKTIAKKYIKDAFFTDLIASFPLELIIKRMNFSKYKNIDLDNTEMMRYLWFLKLLNLCKMSRIINTLQYNFTNELTYTIFHLTKFLISALMIVHWITCLMCMFLLKDIENTGMMWYVIYDTGRDAYLRYFYMTIFTMTSTGYGDILPFSINQKLLTIGIMCFSCWHFAFILTNSKDIMLKYAAQDNFYKDILSKIKKYMQKYSIERRTRVKIVSYLKYLKENSKKSNMNEDDILNELSGPLREEIFVVTRGNVLNRCPFFKYYSYDFLRILIRSLKHAVFAPGDIIIKENDVTNSIFFLLKGRVEIYHQKTQTVFKELNKGRYFGEISFFLRRLRSCSARSLIFSELLSISRYELESILARRPKDNEYHKIFTIQAEINLSLLGVKCYLCNTVGHIAKDCKQFVILIDKKEFIKESDNRRYSHNKKIKKQLLEMQSSKVLVEKFSFENIKGHKFDPAEIFNKSKGLKSKARSYLREDGLMNYRFNISVNNFDDDDKDDEDDADQSDYESSGKNSLLPIEKQYTNQFLKKRHSIADTHLLGVVSNNVEWEDDCENDLITFGAPIRHKSVNDISNLFNPLFPSS